MGLPLNDRLFDVNPSLQGGSTTLENQRGCLSKPSDREVMPDA
jgi:hypothetical protein